MSSSVLASVLAGDSDQSPQQPYNPQSTEPPEQQQVDAQNAGQQYVPSAPSDLQRSISDLPDFRSVAPAPAPQNSNQGGRGVLHAVASAILGHIQGAGKGLLVGGLPGAAAGAVNPEIPQRAIDARAQMQNARIRMASEQAAHMHSLNVRDAFLNSHMEEEYQNQQKENLINGYIRLQHEGMLPRIIDNTPAGQFGDMAQQTALKGASGSTVVLPAGDKALVVELDSMLGTESVPQVVQEYYKAHGQQIDNATWAHTKRGDQTGIARVAVQWSAGSPVANLEDPTRADVRAAQSALDSYKVAQDHLGRLNSPETQRVVAIHQANVDSLNAQHDHWDNMVKAHQQQEINLKYQSAKAQAAGKAAGTPADSGDESSDDHNMYMATLPNHQLVAGTAAEMAAAKITNYVKMGQEEQHKMNAARTILQPGGLFEQVANDIKNIGPQDFGPIASRWNDFVSGKIGAGPQFAALRADMKLLATKMMQAHMGSRGGQHAIEHFMSLADYRISDAATLGAALQREHQYAQSVAWYMPKKGSQ